MSVLAGYRDSPSQDGKNALLPNTHSIPTIGESEQTKDKVSRTTDDILRRLAALGLSLEGKDILEFGCNDGSKLFSLSEKIGGASVAWIFRCTTHLATLKKRTQTSRRKAST